MNRRGFLGSAGVAAASLFLQASEGSPAAPSSKRNGIPTRRLGRIPYEATIVGLGGVTISANAKSIEEGAQLTHSILDEGVNYIDVAPSYGDAQEKIGPAMKTRREEVFLACKTLERSKQGAARELRESLRKLQTDHFDLYQLHGLDSFADTEKVLSEDGALAAFLEAKEQGLIRYIGITGHHTEAIARMLNAYDFDSVLTPVNPFDRFVTRAEYGLIRQARARNASVVAIKPFGDWGNDAGVPEEIALRYVFSRPICVLIPRSIQGYEQKAIEAAREYEGFSREEEEQLLASFGNRLCRQCGYCAPCPKEIDIPLILRLGNYRRWGGFAQLEYTSLSIKGDVCNECGQCEKRCPFEIPIIERLKEVHRKLSA